MSTNTRDYSIDFDTSVDISMVNDSKFSSLPHPVGLKKSQPKWEPLSPFPKLDQAGLCLISGFLGGQVYGFLKGGVNALRNPLMRKSPRVVVHQALNSAGRSSAAIGLGLAVFVLAQRPAYAYLANAQEKHSVFALAASCGIAASTMTLYRTYFFLFLI